MNAKGGVGKSTLVLALADTLSTHHGKHVLVIDSDAHASVSNMLMAPDWLEAAQAHGQTVVDCFIAMVLEGASPDWREFIVKGVSDIDDARTICLMPGGGHLTLFEREISKGGREVLLRKVIRAFLDEVRKVYDYVLIDSAPGLSVLTECWLREADFYLAPTKPDFICVRGLQFLDEFRQRDLSIGFAESLGVVINMRDPHSIADEQFDRWLRQDARNWCFEQSIMRTAALQAAAHFCPRPRSYWAKYPGQTGKCLRYLTLELLDRVAARQYRRAQASTDPTAAASSVIRSIAAADAAIRIAGAGDTGS
jgi:chromosome partitioning protein